MSKKETISLIDTFSEFKELKSIDRSTLISVMEESFRNVLAKMFGTDENFDVIINPDKGDFEIYRNRKVVEDDELEDDNTEISLTEAQKIDEDYSVGEDVTDTVDFISFGRRAILTLRQTLASKIMLSPEIKEEITATIEVQEVFKITKVGTVAGCLVREGKVKRSNKVRVIRDGIVVFSGELDSLKRFKEDVKEVGTNFECGLNIKNYNDIRVGDLIESYEETEVKKTL